MPGSPFPGPLFRPVPPLFRSLSLSFPLPLHLSSYNSLSLETNNLNFKLDQNLFFFFFFIFFFSGFFFFFFLVFFFFPFFVSIDEIISLLFWDEISIFKEEESVKRDGWIDLGVIKRETRESFSNRERKRKSS